MEQTQYNLLFRWFIGLSMDDTQFWCPRSSPRTAKSPPPSGCQLSVDILIVISWEYGMWYRLVLAGLALPALIALFGFQYKLTDNLRHKDDEAARHLDER